MEVMKTHRDITLKKVNEKLGELLEIKFFH